MIFSFRCFLFTLFLVTSHVYAEEKRSYDNYKLLKISPKSKLHLETLSQWDDNSDFDLWTSIKATQEPVTVLLSPAALLKYKTKMALLKMEFEIIHDNVERLFQEQINANNGKRDNEKDFYSEYPRYDDIQSFISRTVSANSDLVRAYSSGQSHQGRELTVAVLGNSQRKVWLDCGIHAREWISPATCLWIIDDLIKDHRSNSDTSLLNYFEFHVLPLINPDGYEYSHTTDRMWRKNRRPGSFCTGVDLNRNYGFQWLTGGSSSFACSDTYAGPEANSEPETKAVQNAIMNHEGDWVAFLTLHSYGLWWFTNWGYTRNLPSNYNDVYSKAKVGVDAIRDYSNIDYELGSSSRILYVASGGSEDWAYGTAKIPYSYCLELRPGQRASDGFYGFALPPSYIPLSGEETFRGIKAFLLAVNGN